MIFACKKCKKCFRKDAEEFEESDEYCPHCDNHFVLEAKVPEMRLEVEGEDARIDSRYAELQYSGGMERWRWRRGLTTVTRMLRDDRVRQDKPKSIWDIADSTDHKLG